MSRISKDIIPVIAGLGLIAFTGIASLFAGRPCEESMPEELRCVISMPPDSSKALLTGYNYHLLSAMCDSLGMDCSICSERDTEPVLDSLLSGAIDLAAVPVSFAGSREGLIVSRSVDDVSVWMMREGDGHVIKAINGWLDNYHDSERYSETRDPFFKIYSPYRSLRRERLSPYDELMKEAADSIGWDWRMLAAIIYQESRFHIEARSPRGAEGLMQIMPAAARKFGAEDLLDPRQSITAGARLLESLSNRYTKLCPEQEERQKYVLAAYNAGHGRIRDCINLGRLRGADISRWDSIVELMPEMRDSSILEVDTVKLGVFKGFETVAYVDTVVSLYDEFCRIYPD